MGIVDRVHARVVGRGRREALTAVVAGLLGEAKPRTLLDLGCGDGKLGSSVADALGASLTSMDPSPRLDAAVTAERFDGVSVPRPADSFDACLLSDVLHHARSPRTLLEEALRVAPLVLVKDHMSFGSASDWVLSMMDVAGNPLRRAEAQYLSPSGWIALFDGVAVTRKLVWPLRVHSRAVALFTRDEHQFAALLERPRA